MFSSPGVFILLFPLACGDTIDTCSSEDSLSSIASHFRQYPNARKLINHTESLYCLVYHSADANFRHNMPCLCARVSFSGTSAESLTFLYQYSPNKTHLYTGVAQAHTNRTDKAYPVDNQIIIKYVIGTMLWVKLDHLLKEEQMPYLCTLTYQLAAEDIRHVVYDWKVCPEMRSYKENTKRPNVGQKREPQ
ncbi:uncharacterized protein LOC119431360 isoform X2 [Dermacentor silvarum]|uniref:uncharacterized protein LOC119431360 isoform X2 n=1 Tax=Dermacentor silvarum TaxID=543639 RepID=UPI0021016134|nr:uncharacterized protein LOC119431360 isoform X2 [Dermacentor silvarum]